MQCSRIDSESPRDYFPQIAAIHIEQLKAGLLASFAPAALERLYRHAARDARCALIVATEDGRVTGFAMGSASPTRFYLGAIIRIWPWLALELIRRPQILKRAASLGQYALAPKSAAGPEPELLSIAVTEDRQRSGVGDALLLHFRAALKSIGKDDFKVTASDTQQAAIRFYQRHGGVVISETDLGGLRSFTYRMPS